MQNIIFFNIFFQIHTLLCKIYRKFQFCNCFLPKSYEFTPSKFMISKIISNSQIIVFLQKYSTNYSDFFSNKSINARFNIGSKAAVLIYEKLGIRPGNHMLNGCCSKNKSRITNARRQTTITKKTRRRFNRA